MAARVQTFIDLTQPILEPIVIDLSYLRSNASRGEGNLSDGSQTPASTGVGLLDDPGTCAPTRPQKRAVVDLCPDPPHPPHGEIDVHSWHSLFAPLLITLCVLGAAFLLFKRAALESVEPTAAEIAAPANPRTRLISDFDVGMRAMGRNPMRGEVESFPEPDQTSSRKLVLSMSEGESGNLSVVLLRSESWIEENGIVEGGTFHLDMSEMGAVGPARVEAILPCPTIESGPGNVVTGVFVHQAEPGQPILSVVFANGELIPGVTDNHPVYSVDRNEFVPIGEMQEGETVLTESGTTSVTTITSRPARDGELLYNIETHNEHVYQVTTAGIVVHNSCITDIRFRGATRIDSLRTATHHDITRAFAHTGFKASSHFISRVKDIRTQRALGLNTFDDLERIFRNGEIVQAGNGLRALVLRDAAIIFNPRTNVLVTLTPW